MPFDALLWSLLAISLVTLLPTALFFACFSSINLSSPNYKSFQTILVSLAVGSLLGDAVYHLIPEALEVSQFRPGQSSMILAGILVFLFGERVLQQYHRGHGHSHLSAIETPTENIFESEVHDEHSHLPQHIGPLIVSSDVMHSFVDGLAIGVSFQTSFSTGISTSIAVVLHEAPHLLGDFSVLLSAGYTRPQLFYYSAATVIASYIGAILVYLSGFIFSNVSVLDASQKALLAFAAGNFLYIALADLVPEILHRRADNADHVFSLKALLQYASILLGAASMLVIKVVFD